MTFVTTHSSYVDSPRCKERRHARHAVELSPQVIRRDDGGGDAVVPESEFARRFAGGREILWTDVARRDTLHAREGQDGCPGWGSAALSQLELAAFSSSK